MGKNANGFNQRPEHLDQAGGGLSSTLNTLPGSCSPLRNQEFPKTAKWAEARCASSDVWTWHTPASSGFQVFDKILGLGVGDARVKETTSMLVAFEAFILLYSDVRQSASRQQKGTKRLLPRPGEAEYESHCPPADAPCASLPGLRL